MGIFALITGTIFRLASSTVAATKAVVDVNNREITLNAFCTMLKDHFESLPGNAVMVATSSRQGNGYVSNITFQNIPTAFNWGGRGMSAEAIRLSVVQGREGMDVILHYYDSQILDDEESNAEDDVEPLASIVLLEGLSYCEWQFINGQNLNEENFDWSNRRRQPFQVIMKLSYGKEDEEIRRVFWIPTKPSPVGRIQQLQNTARNSGTGAAGAGNTNNNGNTNFTVDPERDVQPQPERGGTR